ncbi:DUF4919 domain-containing protein [Pontimicrobium sp. MEBiC01747]
MTEEFFNFISETTKENFVNAQNAVKLHPAYNPYSEDLSIMEDLLDEKKFQEAADYSSINVLLSPRAHLYKNYALGQLNNVKDAESELFFAQKIMEGIETTGDGSEEYPYIVTRVSDERDLLNYLQEKFISQRLVNKNNQYFDLINCESGTELYFDITEPYLKMQQLMNDGEIKTPFNIKQESNKNTVSKPKKWWKFWG